MINDSIILEDYDPVTGLLNCIRVTLSIESENKTLSTDLYYRGSEKDLIILQQEIEDILNIVKESNKREPKY